MYFRFDSEISCASTHNLVDPTGLDIVINRRLGGYCDEIPDIELEVVLHQLTVSEKSFFKAQIHFK